MCCLIVVGYSNRNKCGEAGIAFYIFQALRASAYGPPQRVKLLLEREFVNIRHTCDLFLGCEELVPKIVN